MRLCNDGEISSSLVSIITTLKLQTATRGQIWPQCFFFFDNFFGVSDSDTNFRDFVTTSVL